MIAQLKERLDESTLSLESEDSSSDETASGSKNVTFTNNYMTHATNRRFLPAACSYVSLQFDGVPQSNLE